jgi:signal transduction histidine kinase
MPNFYLLLDLIVVVSLFILALTVLIKNHAITLNRIFAFFVLCISVWILANYVSNDLSNSTRIATVANYFVFSFSFAASIFLLEFVVALTNDQQAKRLLRKARIPLWLVVLISCTPVVVAGVTPQEQLYAVNFGPLAPLYFVTLIINIAAVGIILWRNKRRATGNQKGRLTILFRSFYWTFPVLILAQAVIPATTGWFGFTNIGILPMLILVFGLYYSVVKHRLFDLRLIVVRAMGYLATLATISVLYGLITHYLVSFTRSIRVTGVSDDLINSAFIVVAVLSYGPLKKVFDKLTNRFFFQDAYDPQEFLDNLNQVLVSTIELDALLSKTAEIIERDLKAEFCAFSIHQASLPQPRIVGMHKPKMDQVELVKALDSAENASTKVYVAEYLDDEQRHLKSMLRQNNIAVIVRLASAAQADGVGIGLIFLGVKKSGSAYNSQDTKVLEIVANELVIAIQNALRFEEIQNFNIKLTEEVETATQHLRQTNERLRLLDQTKDDFISMASHQLRTPLTSVKGYLSMVLEGDAGKLNPKERKLLTQAFSSSQRMVYLIADLLNLSRLKTGKFIIEPSAVNLAEIIEGEVKQLIETAASRNLKLTYHKPKTFPTLLFDETKIRQVIMNFIDNAIHYTPGGGHIDVYLGETPRTVELTVVDDGIGVSRHEQVHLFTKFFRASNARQARPDGTGLGLYMAKKVIIAHGGSTLFKSQPSKGSTFGFTFPKSKLALPVTTHQPEPQPEIPQIKS